MILIEIIYFLLCLLMAWNDSLAIAKGKRIIHAINGGVHLAVAVVVAIFFVWWAGLIILCEARIVFSTALNKFRGLDFDYVTPEKVPGSIVDRIEKKIFGMNGWLPLLIYTVVFIVLNILWIREH